MVDTTGPVSQKIQNLVYFIQDNVDDQTIQNMLINTLLAEGITANLIQSLREYGREKVQSLRDELKTVDVHLLELLDNEKADSE